MDLQIFQMKRYTRKNTFEGEKKIRMNNEDNYDEDDAADIHTKTRGIKLKSLTARILVHL